MATKKTTCAKECAGKCPKADCPKECAQKGVQEIKDKVVETVKKIPQWLVRAQAELKQLIERLTKLQVMLDKLSALVAEKKATKEDKENLRLLTKQAKAMAAYRAALEERIAKAKI